VRLAAIDCIDAALGLTCPPSRAGMNILGLKSLKANPSDQLVRYH